MDKNSLTPQELEHYSICQRCNYEWLRRYAEHLPRFCPKCKSQAWRRHSDPYKQRQQDNVLNYIDTQKQLTKEKAARREKEYAANPWVVGSKPSAGPKLSPRPACNTQPVDTSPTVDPSPTDPYLQPRQPSTQSAILRVYVSQKLDLLEMAKPISTHWLPENWQQLPKMIDLYKIGNTVCTMKIEMSLIAIQQLILTNHLNPDKVLWSNIAIRQQDVFTFCQDGTRKTFFPYFRELPQDREQKAKTHKEAMAHYKMMRQAAKLTIQPVDHTPKTTIQPVVTA